MTGRRSMMRCERAAAAAEFALVLPLMLLLLFGIIDVGRFMYIVNRAEKATQIGVRMAVVTTPLSPDLIEADYASASIPTGSLIPADQLGRLTCSSSVCECTTAPCPTASGPVDAVAHGQLVARMDDILNGIEAGNVRVSYSGSGFGYAGSLVAGPGGGGAAETMEISPLVTVELDDLEFWPITWLMFMPIELPSFTSTLPAEDASGTISN